MDRNPPKTAARQEAWRRLFGSDAACVLCGIADLEKLTRASKGLLEIHHVLGRRIDRKLTITLCKNCHARATENQRRGEVPMSPENNVLDRLVAALQGAIAFLQDLMDAAERWREEIEELRQFLDTEQPHWRERWRFRK